MSLYDIILTFQYLWKPITITAFHSRAQAYVIDYRVSLSPALLWFSKIFLPFTLQAGLKTRIAKACFAHSLPLSFSRPTFHSVSPEIWLLHYNINRPTRNSWNLHLGLLVSFVSSLPISSGDVLLQKIYLAMSYPWINIFSSFNIWCKFFEISTKLTLANLTAYWKGK